MSQLQILKSSGGGGSGNVLTLTANSGGAVGPDGGGNINTVGDGTTINGVGNPGTNTITFSITGIIPDSFPTDSGTAIPSAGVLNILGGSGITTSASGNTITIDASGGGGITTIDGDTGSATGATVTLDANTNSGSTVLFDASGSTVSLKVSDASGNTFIGAGAGNPATTANQALAVGANCLPAITSGNYNTAIGQNTLVACQDGEGNVGIGTDALFSNISGDYNFGMGFLSLFNLSSGDKNICIGRQTGINYVTTESFNICIGDDVGGTAAESGVVRIGNIANQTSCFIQGIAGVTVSNDDAVLIDTTTGQLGTVSSSRRYKENIVDMDSSSDPIYNLRPVTFSYKKDQCHKQKYGLIAEEVHETMPNLVTYNLEGNPESVRYHDLPSLLLNEIQKLNKRVKNLEDQLYAAHQK